MSGVDNAIVFSFYHMPEVPDRKNLYFFLRMPTKCFLCKLKIAYLQTV